MNFMKNIMQIFGFMVLLVIYSCEHKMLYHEYFAELLTNDNTNIENNKRNNLSAPHLELAPKEYIRWIEDKEHGIQVKKTIGDYTFATVYKPYEYLIAREIKKDSISAGILDEKINSINDLQYFSFRISAENQNTELLKVGLSSQDEYYARIEYCSFKMQQDIKLVDNNDTLNCVLFHFERVYNIAPYATFVLGFPLTEKEKKDIQQGKKIVHPDKTLSYEDKIFGIGKVNLTIKGENINRIPKLKTY